MLFLLFYTFDLMVKDKLPQNVYVKCSFSPIFRTSAAIVTPICLCVKIDILCMLFYTVSMYCSL